MKNQVTVISYSLLSGLSILIPVPFLDDAVANFFSTQMVAVLAKSYSVPLTSSELSVLATGHGIGCLNALLDLGVGQTIKVVLRRTLKDFIFLWEAKEIVERIVACFYMGYFYEVVFSEGYYHSGDMEYTRRVNQLVIWVSGQANNQVLVDTLTQKLKHSSKIVLKISGLIAQAAVQSFHLKVKSTFRKKAKAKYEVDPSSTQVMNDLVQLPELNQLVTEFMANVSALPADHFIKLKSLLKANLHQ
jgi:hypothetical protein